MVLAGKYDFGQVCTVHVDDLSCGDLGPLCKHQQELGSRQKELYHLGDFARRGLYLASCSYRHCGVEADEAEAANSRQQFDNVITQLRIYYLQEACGGCGVEYLNTDKSPHPLPLRFFEISLH